MRPIALALLLAAACAHATQPPAVVPLALGREDDSYLAADEVRQLSLDSPGGPLLVTCRMSGEGSYAKVEVRRGPDVLGRGTCGDKIRIVDAPTGQLDLSVRAFGAPGALHLVADRAPVDAAATDAPSGDPPENALAAALKARDETALDGFLMDDFSANVGGKMLDRRGYPDAAAQNPAMIADPANLRTRAHGQTALVTLTLGGAPATDTWVSEGRRWRLLARQQ